MTTLRDERIRELDPDAPRPPAGRRPQAGVVDGCGDFACPHCYEADGPPIGERQVQPEGRPRCGSCGRVYPEGRPAGCPECEVYERTYQRALQAARAAAGEGEGEP